MVFIFVLFIGIQASFVSANEWTLPNNFLHKNTAIINKVSCCGLSWSTIAISSGVFFGINAARHYFLMQPALKMYRIGVEDVLAQTEKRLNGIHKSRADYITELNNANKIYLDAKKNGTPELIKDAWLVYYNYQTEYAEQLKFWASNEDDNLFFYKIAKQKLASCDDEIKWSYYKGVASLVSFCGIAALQVRFNFFR